MEWSVVVECVGWLVVIFITIAAIVVINNK